MKTIISKLALVFNVVVAATIVSMIAAATTVNAEAETGHVSNETVQEIIKDVDTANWQIKMSRVDVDYFLYNPEQYTEEFCMAQNIYFEAGIDNHAGMAAVADVVLNRINHTFYPNTVCGVVYQGQRHASGAMKRNKCQFSWYCDGKADTVPKGSENWVRAQMVAWEIMHEDRFRGITEGATHYHATYVSPVWRKDRGMDLIGRVGAHIFYRWN